MLQEFNWDLAINFSALVQVDLALQMEEATLGSPVSYRVDLSSLYRLALLSRLTADGICFFLFVVGSWVAKILNDELVTET